MHTVLGFIMCSLAYTEVVLAANNIYKLFVSFKLIDTMLSAVTGQKSNFRNFSNRFQMNLISTGLALFIAVTALDTTIYEM